MKIKNNSLQPDTYTRESLRDLYLKKFLEEKKGSKIEIAFSNSYKELIRLASLNIFKEQQQVSKYCNEVRNISDILGLNKVATRIEVIDASHIMGSFPMVGKIVFEKGELKKKDYRIYRFEELDNSRDDYMILREWAKRRFSAGSPWPDILMVDGGKGQINSVAEMFSFLFFKQIPFKIIGIAKGNKRSDKSNRLDKILF